MVSWQQAYQAVQAEIDTYEPAIFRILVGETDISSLINNRLISLTIDDKRGLEADSVSIELTDHDGLLAIPALDATIHVYIGWESTGLIYKGMYTVTEVEHSGTPDVITLRAVSADLRQTLKRKKERSFDQQTIEQIIGQIAFDNLLTPLVHNRLAHIKVAHIDQNESDANLITRLADEHNAVATVKADTLLFMPKGSSESASGWELPQIIIKRSAGDSHRYSKTGRGDKISGVSCYYYDAKTAMRKKVLVGDASLNVKELRNYLRDQQSALNYAKAEYAKLKRDAATFSIQLAKGNPEIIPEMEIYTLGFKPEIDDIIWIGTTIRHSLTANGGYTTAIDAEVKLPDMDEISQLVENDNEQYTGVIAYYKNGKGSAKVLVGNAKGKTPKRLCYLYKTKAAAQAAAQKEWKMIQAKDYEQEQKKKERAANKPKRRKGRPRKNKQPDNKTAARK